MMTWFTDRNHAREHAGSYRDTATHYALKGFDDLHGLACLLDGSLGGPGESTQTLGCHFGYNSFLDYGAEFLCSDFVAIHETRAFSGPVERKFTDADWNWVLYQQQASLKNLSTFLDPKDGLEGSMALIRKSDVKTAPDPSISCGASKMPFCPHARRNRPRRVHMVPALGSKTASLVFLKESMLYYSVRGRASMEALPFRSFSTGIEDFKKGQDGALRWVNACSPPCVDRLSLSSLLSDDGAASAETKLLDFLSPPSGLTDLIPSSECHTGTIRPSFFESVSPIPNRFIDKKTDIKVSDNRYIGVVDEDIEILGKALCHAQTRARLAEKLAEKTLQENKRLEQLLIREVWTTHTYRQRALALELENGLLKLHPKLGSGVMMGKDNARISELKTRALWKLTGKQLPRQSAGNTQASHSSQSKRSKPPKKVSLSSMEGLAFLLGLSIAGAGIAIVWGIGWIFF